MRLIIDANRLMAGLLKDSVSRQIIHNDKFKFYSPDFVLEEIKKHKKYLIKKSKTTEDGFEILLSMLRSRISLITYEDMESEFDVAEKIMEPIDIKDTPYLATGLYIRADGIWSQDKGFLLQDKLRVYTTNELYELIK